MAAARKLLLESGDVGFLGMTMSLGSSGLGSSIFGGSSTFRDYSSTLGADYSTLGEDSSTLGD